MSVGKPEGAVLRLLSSHGITVYGSHYNSQRLQEIRRSIGPPSNVYVRQADPDDVAFVYVHDFATSEWTKVPLIE